MSKPLQDNIRAVRVEDEDGSLRPLLEVAGEKLSTLIKAVTETGKVGSLTLKIDVKPSTAGALAVKGDVSTKLPKGMPRESLLWPTPEGNLLDEDPSQHKLPLSSVPLKGADSLQIANG